MWKLNNGTWIKKLFPQPRTRRTNRPPKPHEESPKFAPAPSQITTPARDWVNPTPQYQFSKAEASFPGHKNHLFDLGRRHHNLSQTSPASGRGAAPASRQKRDTAVGAHSHRLWYRESVSQSGKQSKPISKESTGSGPGAAREDVLTLRERVSPRAVPTPLHRPPSAVTMPGEHPTAPDTPGCSSREIPAAPSTRRNPATRAQHCRGLIHYRIARVRRRLALVAISCLWRSMLQGWWRGVDAGKGGIKSPAPGWTYDVAARDDVGTEILQSW
jgi:hypothetical protein